MGKAERVGVGYWIVMLVSTLLGGGMSPAKEQSPRPSDSTTPYSVIATIAGRGTGGIWDYATYDRWTDRIYLAQSGVTVLDLRSRTVIPEFVEAVDTAAVVPTHSIVPLDRGREIAVSDSSSDSVRFFSARSGKLIGQVRVGSGPSATQWRDPDQILYDPWSRMLIAVNGDAGSLALVDPQARKLTGVIDVGGGRLEHSATNGHGVLYVNEETKDSIAVVDLVHGKLLRTIHLPNCSEPTGLDYDARDALIISVCSSGIVEFVSTLNGRIVASIPVDSGADAVLFDAKRDVAFSPSGDEGTVTVIAVHGTRDIHAIQTIRTRKGSRLGVLDEETGDLYLPAAKFGPPAKPLTLPGLEPMPGMNPGTFEFLVVGRR